MKLKLVASILLALLLALAVTPVYADDAPSLPHAFYGTVDINGSPAPVGTEVEVRGEGVQTGVGNNPVVTTVEGEYGGGSDPMAPKLIVQGSVTEGDTVTFYVNGFDTGQTAHWRSGELTEVNLSATIEEDAVPDETPQEPPPETPDSTPPETPDQSPPETPDQSPPETTEPEPEVAAEDDSSAPVLPPPPPSDGGIGGVPVLWLLIGGAVLEGLIIAFWIARSRAY